jgi:hypothetical protein
VVRVEQRAAIGAGRLEQSLRNSEDSAKLNTSIVERLISRSDRAQPIWGDERFVRLVS